jgi:thioredoxin-related protein
MKKLISLLLIFALAAGLFYWAVSPPDLGTPDPEVEKLFHPIDFAAALDLAGKENKVVMLDFTTSDCVFCRKLERNTFKKEAVQKFLNEKTISIKVDGRGEREMVEKFAVNGYPTLVFLDGKGSELGRLEGYVPPQVFLDEAGRFVKTH